MKPEWLSVKPASDGRYAEIKDTTSALGLHTVCVEARCPNLTECWSSGTATVMVLGEKCTRGCRFCAVSKSAIGPMPDPREPEKLAEAIGRWGLNYVVITSVCRDDLEDQGASHFAKCVEAVRSRSPGTVVEVLIPDFRGEERPIRAIVDSKPDVIGHNVETVERLSPNIRDRRASYRQSLNVLRIVKEIDRTRYTKSAIMLGIGESDDEVRATMRDMRDVSVDFIAIGQYLRPNHNCVPVNEYVAPEKFERFGREALEMGFRYAAAGPFVRSSYKAGEHFMRAIIKG